MSLARFSRSANRPSLHVASRLRARPAQISRPLSVSSYRLAEHNPNKQRDAQLDREKINTDANEYAKSGTDDTAASNPEAAFDSNTPDPGDAKEQAGKGNEVNPLDSSPANATLGTPTRESTGERKKGEIS